MKKFVTIALVLILALQFVVFASMSDSAALKTAISLWGATAFIGTGRDSTASNWSRMVGYKSPGCVNEFTVAGKGFNTWDSAFADAATKPTAIRGTYKGVINISWSAFDDIGVASTTLVIDGVAEPQMPISPPVPIAQITQSYNTTVLKDGMHVLCAQASDATGNVGKSYVGMLFKTDQTAGNIADMNLDAPHSKYPSISTVFVIN
jgi:hypothetical protein